jgi:hypothetical protein
MKYIIALSMMLMLLTLSGCEVIGDIFSAGMYTGIFVVVFVIAIIIWLVTKMGKRG